MIQTKAFRIFIVYKTYVIETFQHLSSHFNIRRHQWHAKRSNLTGKNTLSVVSSWKQRNIKLIEKISELRLSNKLLLNYDITRFVMVFEIPPSPVNKKVNAWIRSS